MGHDHTHPEPDLSRAPSPDEPVPAVAWPTLALFVAAAALFAASTTLAIEGTIPVVAGVLLNSFSSFLFFTVMHECSHRTAGTSETLNVWLGRLSTVMVTPLAAAPVFRYIHMQHHMNTNAHDGSDPDAYTSEGPAWTWPLRWATIDLHYLRFYARRIGGRPRREHIEEAVSLVLVFGTLLGLTLAGHGMEVLLYYLLPTRISVTFLGWSFDHLPHHGLGSLQDDRFRATRNRVGWERLLTPALLYQNYHLVHHLHPRIPFYRYIAAWRKNEEEYLARDPALSTALGRDMTVAEYRRVRGLDDGA